MYTSKNECESNLSAAVIWLHMKLWQIDIFWTKLSGASFKLELMMFAGGFKTISRSID